MRSLVQRVSRAEVEVAGSRRAAIGEGLLILLGVAEDDGEEEIARMSRKIVNLRIFNDEDGKFNRSLLDVGGDALVVSQFTLCADVRRGRRPSFTTAAKPEIAEPMVARFARALHEQGVQTVETSVFGAHMEVSLTNTGPVTIWLDSRQLTRS